MKPIARTALLAGAIVAAAPALPAAANNLEALVLRQKIFRLTPQCRDFPQYPVVGRVVGFVGYRPPANVSFVGCFPDYRSCQRWVGPVSGEITGRLIRADCAPRF